MNIMAEENDAVMAEVMNLLEAEPAAVAVGPDIPAVPEQLAILVSTGKCTWTLYLWTSHTNK